MRSVKCGGRRVVVLMLALAAGGAACRHRLDKTEPNDSSPLVATVDGAPITEAELASKLRSSGHQVDLSDKAKHEALESLINEQILYQQALDLGLAAGQRGATNKRELAELFLQESLRAEASVSDAEVQNYFGDHASDLRAVLHVEQLLFRDAAASRQTLALLEQGKSFGEVARSLYPTTAGKKPWDMGYLRWQQVPSAWRSVVYGLAPGTHSPVIVGPNERYWIVQLVDRHDDPEVTFESMAPKLAELLTADRREEQKGKMIAALRAKSEVVVVAASNQRR